jgi:phosphate transport system substrate-binding protein
MIRSILTVLAILTFGAVALAEVRLVGAGATFPNPLYQKWVSEFGKRYPDAKLDYQSIGSGGGIRGIKERTLSFAGSDAPLSRKDRDEMQAAGFDPVHIPTVAGSVVLAYNLPSITGELRLSGEVIVDIYMGKITRWNDSRIVELNPGIALPDLGIISAHRTDGSGTTFIFTNYLATQSDAFREAVGVGTAVRFPTGQGGKGNEGVTSIVSGTPGAIGYVEHLYAAANKINYALVRNKDGKFVKATTDSVAAAGEGAAAAMSAGGRLAVPLWNQPGEHSYPIAAFTYLIVYRDLGYLGEQDKAQTLVNFLHWSIGDEAQKLANDMGYAPLNAAVREKVVAELKTLNFKGQPLTASK